MLSDAAVASDNFGHCTKSRTPAAVAVDTVAALRAWVGGHVDGVSVGQRRRAGRAGDDVMREGFLGTAAPPYTDLILVLEIAMGAGLLIGALLARRRRFRAHAWCQSTVVLLNLAVIALVMIPSFRAHVSPEIPLKLGRPYYLLATAHAALGTIAEIAGLYILLAAGTGLLPARVRITNYRLWMRTVLVLWWVVLLSGLATYARWYVPHLF